MNNEKLVQEYKLIIEALNSNLNLTSFRLEEALQTIKTQQQEINDLKKQITSLTKGLNPTPENNKK